MDRKQLKAQSKNLIRTAQPKPVVTAIIYLLIISVLGFLSYKLVGGSSFELQSVYEQFGIGYDVGFGTGAYDSFDPDQFAYAIEQALPTPGAALLNLAVGIVSLVIGAGFTIYCLRTVRGMQQAIGTFSMRSACSSVSSGCTSSRVYSFSSGRCCSLSPV